MIEKIIKYTVRFWKSTSINDKGCWIWNLARHSKTGHGLVSVKNIQVYVHRYIFCLYHNLDYKSPILALHICNTPACWNPLHLYGGTHSDNMRDTVKAGTHKEAKKTHCSRGHEYNSENTMKNNRKRSCRACARLRDKNRKRITVNGKRQTVPGTRKI